MPDEYQLDGRPQSLGEFVPAADFVLPPAPAQDLAAKRLTALWRLVRGEGRKAQSPAKTYDELQALREGRMAHLVPPIDWQPAARALGETFENWLGQESTGKPIRFLIGPPYSGQGDILHSWAKIVGWPIIAPPNPAQILTQDDAWMAHWPHGKHEWVLPNLEHCYMRHGGGLTLVRRLLDRAVSGQLGRGLIGCDSWAWAYLQKVWNE
jgi:hypothetical protein